MLRERFGKNKEFTMRSTYEADVKRASTVFGEESQQYAAALAALNGPEVPEPLEYLWRWFCELDSRRAEGMNGVAPLTDQQLQAWSANSGHELAPSEVSALFTLDNAIRFPNDTDKREGA